MFKLGDPLRGLIVSLAAALLITAVPIAAAPAVSESAVKAALLLKLGRYIYFPGEEQPGKLVVCVLGQSRMKAELEQLVAALPDDRPVSLEYPASAAAAGGCHLVYVPRSEQRRWSTILRELEGVAAVTLSDISGFAQRGGMVEMLLDPQGGGQIQLLINRENAARHGIEFNAQLLRLATLVD